MKKILISIFMFMGFTSCSQLFTAVPYLVSGEMRLNEEGKNEYTSFNFQLKNCGEKDIYAFTLSFFLFDEEGNPVSNGNPKITCIIQREIHSGETLESSYSLDNFLSNIPEAPYSVEYLYVQKIIYKDGTEWSDPAGIKAMKNKVIK